MLIYFDESYDSQSHNRLILGACFHPHPKFLHRKMTNIKDKYSFVNKDGTLAELKYSNCHKKEAVAVAKEITDAFFESTSYFRAIVIPQGEKWFDLNKYGDPGEDKKMKTARMYKKFTQLLIEHNTEDIFNAVLLTDGLTRCQGDRFMLLMQEEFCVAGQNASKNKQEPTLKYIKDVESDLEQYQLLQITDLFMGCILNQLTGSTNKGKKEISQYVTDKIGVESLLPSNRGQYSKAYVEEYYPKFNVRYRKPGFS